MNNGFVDSTVNSKRRNLQVETQILRKSGGELYGATKTLNVSKLLPFSNDQRHSTLVLGTRGAGGLIAKDIFYGDGTGSVNRYPLGSTGIRALGEYAVDLQLATTDGPFPSFSNGAYGDSIGVKTAKGLASGILAGRNNSATGSYAGIVGGENNSAQIQYSFIGGGASSIVYGAYGANLGGSGNYNNAFAGVILSGIANTAYGQYSSIISGYQNQTLSGYSVTLGGRYLRTTTNGEIAFGGTTPNSGRTSGSLINLLALSGANSNNGNCEMSTEYSNFSNISDQYSVLNISDYQTVAFGGTLIGVADNGDTKIFAIKCCARKPGINANQTALLGTPVIDLLHSSANASMWTVSIETYASSFGGLKFIVNSGSTTVRWSLTGTVNRISTN